MSDYLTIVFSFMKYDKPASYDMLTLNELCGAFIFSQILYCTRYIHYNQPIKIQFRIQKFPIKICILCLLD